MNSIDDSMGGPLSQKSKGAPEREKNREIFFVPLGPSPEIRSVLPEPPGYESRPLEETFGFKTQSMKDFLVTKALKLLNARSEKVQASVFHDLLEVEGLMGSRSAPPEPPRVPSSQTLNAFLLDPEKSRILLEHIKTIASGMAPEIESKE